MLGECFDHSPQTQVYYESDRRAYENFQLRDDAVINALIRRCPYPLTVFKPLTKLHLLHDLLSIHGGRAIWIFRWYQDRVKSSVTRFGTSNLEFLSALALNPRWETWHAGGLTRVELDLVQSFDYSRLSPYAASCLYWYLRNTVYFNQGYDTRDDITIVSYDALVSQPETQMRKLCHFIGLGYRRALIRDIHAQSSKREMQLALPFEITQLCNAMYERLSARFKLIDRQ